jgi:hypothetical protein
VPALAIFTVSACNFEVTNPGPTGDALLDSLNAHTAIVVGTQGDLSDAMLQIGYWSAAMVFEINPAGSTGSFGIPTYIQAGRFDEGDTGDWNAASQARWTAEDAVRRFEEVLPQIEGAPSADSYEPLARAALWAGYANRLLGENFCQVVFDQGSPEAHTAAFARAEQWFTRAQSVAAANGDIPDVVTAAYAGRASVRALLARYGLAQWSDAVSDAGQVTDNSFVWVLPFSEQDQDQHNYLFWANGNEPYRAHTIWATWYEDYFEATADPRASWQVGDCPGCPDPANPTGDAAVQKFTPIVGTAGLVPWFPQTKFDDKGSPINLSSGWEMRLLEAENELVGGNVGPAIAIMQARVDDLNANGATIPALSATTVAEGYTVLKEQRMFELWLEARRMGDIRSWIENGAPGTFMDAVWVDMDDDGTNETIFEDLSTRHRAYPIGQSEREVNSNVDPTPVFCTP